MAGVFFEANVEHVKEEIVEKALRLIPARLRQKQRQTVENTVNLITDSMIERALETARRGEDLGWVATIAAEQVMKAELRNGQSTLAALAEQYRFST